MRKVKERGRGKAPAGPGAEARKEKKGCASLRVAERLLQLRQVAGPGGSVLRQKDLATKAGVSLNTLVRTERAEGQVGVDNLEQIAKALGVGLDQLVR